MTTAAVAAEAGGRRTAILDAAVATFARYGFKKTSMDDLARAAGLSRQGLYLHFDAKEALFKAAVLRMIDGARDAGRAALARSVPIEERLVKWFGAIHGHLIGTADAEHMDELFATASTMLAPEIAALEEGQLADLERVLRAEGIAAAWKDEKLSAKDLAQSLFAVSYGTKHRVATQAEYAERMKVAIHMACARRRKR